MKTLVAVQIPHHLILRWLEMTCRCLVAMPFPLSCDNASFWSCLKIALSKTRLRSRLWNDGLYRTGTRLQAPCERSDAGKKWIL
jgi:hypothetical protein